MAYANGIRIKAVNRLIQEADPRWSLRSTNVSNPEVTLEDEIHTLRKRMEQLFNQEQSLTSALVIEISNMLDVKINEYMHSLSKSR